MYKRTNNINSYSVTNCNSVIMIDEGSGIKPSWYKLLFHGNPQTV